MTTEFLKPLIAADMAEVDRVLRESLDSDVALIRQVAEHIIGGGGKRLRPALLLLSARACGYGGTRHHTLAAVVEMIHTATLLHDDVVDDSKLRRGHATANTTFGNSASVLVGDFLYSRAFQQMVGQGSLRVLEILSSATNVIAQGEVLQLINSGDPDLDEEAYLGVIRRKTAKLFEAAAQLGAVVGDAPPELEAALGRYGMHLGTAFQLVDDVLDYSGDLDAIGKNLGDDLAEGKMTLPLIRARDRRQRRRQRAHPRRDHGRPADGIRAGRGRARAHRRARLHAGARRARKRRRRRMCRRPARYSVPEKSARISVLRGPADVLKNAPAVIQEASIRTIDSTGPIRSRKPAKSSPSRRGCCQAMLPATALGV